MADFRKGGLALGNDPGMSDKLDELLDAVPLLRRFDEDVAPQLVRGNDGRHLDVRCFGLDRLEDIIGYRPLLL